MLPLHRWFVCALGVLMSASALAQAAAAAPTIDESKLPEWVKRQARSPYKVIIESGAARARTPVSVPKEDNAARLAKKAAMAAAAVAGAAPVAVPAIAKPDPPATAGPAPTVSPEAVTPGSELRDTDAALTRPETVPGVSKLTLIEARSATLQLATATANTAVTAAATSAATAAANTAATTVTLPAPAPELSPLTLLNRVEPAFPPDLVNDRLNQANVVVSFTVKAGGEVVNVSFASTSDSRLNRSVLRAVRAWRYAPIDAPREHSVRFAFTNL